MNKRIRDLRKALGLTQKEFAQYIGMKQNAISHIEKDGSTVTEKNVQSICRAFDANEVWLRTGNGEMFLEYNKKQKEFLDVFQGLSPALQDYLIKTARDLLETQSKIQSSK